MPNKSRVFIITLCFTSLSAFSSINDPTKPIFSDVPTEHIATTPLIHQKKRVILQSVFHSQKSKSAVINGRLVQEGDVVDDIVLRSIHKSHVVIEYKKNTVTLHISKKIYIDKVTGDVSDK